MITRLGEGKQLSALLAISKKLIPLGIVIGEEPAPGDAGRLELPLPLALHLFFLDGRRQIRLRGRKPPIAKTLPRASAFLRLHDDSSDACRHSSIHLWDGTTTFGQANLATLSFHAGGFVARISQLRPLRRLHLLASSAS